MKLGGIRQKVFLDRYSLKDKNGTPLEKIPREMWRRVARGVAQYETDPSRKKEWEKKFYSAMEDFKYIPGGRILSGAGTGYKVTFYNCYVLPCPADSRDGILDNLKEMVEIMARGGGVGVNLSSLRPRGARVKKVNGFSSGPMNWAELYSVATHDIIQQGGTRRGALMLMLWDWHPDIEEFITVKRDLSRITGANLSVCVSDSFMDAVAKDKDWDLVFPDLNDSEYDSKWDGYLADWVAKGKKVKKYKTIKARKLWDLICEAAWTSAEPGVVFMERYNKWHSNYYFNRINCVNPCVAGDTLVTTDNGFKKAKDLKVGDKILTPKGFKPIKKFYNNGVKRIYKVKFSDQGELRATADHKLKVLRESKEKWIKIADLKKGDQVIKLSSLLRSSNKSWQGNQNYDNEKKENENSQKQLGIQLRNIDNHNFAFLASNRLIAQNNVATVTQTIIPSQLTPSTLDTKGGKTASAKTTWPMSAVMSDSFLSSNRESRNLSNKSSFPLAIDNILAKKKLIIDLASVLEVEDTGKSEEVFDVYEPETLTWITNGYVSLDCGEEGLPAYGVCNLGSLNLAAFVKDGKMDYKSLYEHAKIGTRFQDNIIDGDIYIFEGIRKTQLEGERRIGLGTMGLGDALIKMKIRYGSDGSLKVIDKIYKLIRDAAFEESVELSREKGVFPKYNKEKYLKAYFIKQLPASLRKNISKYGIRNSVILMQAPTGSTSLMAGVSSGIEPVYEFTFIRRDRLGEHKLYHPLFEDWKKKHPNETIPEYFVSSSDLTPDDHVRVQAAIQKYVDASISKTVNAPKAYTVDDVKKLYNLAYKLGCKGITFMRDGSRPGVLEKDDKKPESVNGEVKVDGVKFPIKKPRPMVVHGSTYQVETPVGITYITINSDYDKEPFEVFITVGKAGSDVGAMADAIGRLISLNLRIISPLSPNDRLKKVADQLIGIGGARSIGFGEKRVRSLPDAIAKVIAMHSGFKYKNGNGEVKPKLIETNGQSVEAETPIVTASLQSSLPYQTHEFDLCPECGLASLAFEEGCKKCYSCGYSEC